MLKLNKIYNGDCLEVMKDIDDNSIDAVVTDPPYGISFMGKKWDYEVPSVKIWKECLRVLKPGGYLLSFASTRTQHRMCCNIEDAGFEIRDMLAWVYGSGFPISHNIGKAVDKMAGAERKIIGIKKHPTAKDRTGNKSPYQAENNHLNGNSNITAPATPEAQQWEGWGTNLKPAMEPLTLAQKSLSFNMKFNSFINKITCNLGEIIWQSIANTLKQDMFKLQEMVLTALNTVLLWNSILTEISKNGNKFTISMELKMITELKILNFLLLQNTQEYINTKYQTFQNGTQKIQVNGYLSFVKIVEKILSVEKGNWQNIQTVIVQENAIYQKNKNGIFVKNADKNLLLIIQNANIVLKSVSTLLLQEYKGKELKKVVFFVEKNLNLSLAEIQNIAELNVCQKHIKNIIPNLAPITMARKPPSEKTIAANVLKWGTGGINIDDCRVETKEQLGREQKDGPCPPKYGFNDNKMGNKFQEGSPLGRFPANIIHDGSQEVLDVFPDSKGAASQNNNSSVNMYKGQSLNKSNTELNG